MAYIGENCPVCGAVFTEADDIVVCPECGTPHHRGCYSAHGGCANAEKHAEGFAWTPSNPAPSMGGMQPVPQDAAGTVICPRCGAPNAAEEPVCTNCGARLYLRPTPMPPMPQGQMPDWSNAPYVAGGTLISPDETIGGNTVRDTAQYVRVAAHRYIPKFYKLEKKGGKVSWNWAAFFFAPYWFFYRKLYAVGSILLVLLLAVSAATTTPRYIEKSDAVSEAAEQVRNAQQLSDEDFAAYEEKLTAFSTLPEVLISAGVEIAVHLFAGLFGNFFYKRRIDGQVQKLCALVPSGEDRQILLFRQGGVSFLAAIGSILLYRFALQGIYLAISSFLT